VLHLVPKRTLQMVSTQVFDYGTKMYEVLHQLDGELNTKRFAVIYCHVGQSGEIMPKKFYRLESWNFILNFISS